MCGRYSLYPNPDDPRVSAILSMMDRRYPGAYKTGEIFPGDRVPAIVEDRGRIVPVPAVFGFPGFEPGRRLINARAETAAQKPTFALALQAFSNGAARAKSRNISAPCPTKRRSISAAFSSACRMRPALSSSPGRRTTPCAASITGCP